MTKQAPPKRAELEKLPTLPGVGSFAFQAPPSIGVLSELKSASQPPPAAWQALIRHYLKALGMPKASLSLLLCGDARSRKLNRAWRGKDKPTDVLSFPQLKGRPKPGFQGQLGDIALNLPYAKRKLGRFAPDMPGEAAFLLLHGLLHLAGRHHDTPQEEAAMWRLSRKHFPPPPALLKRLAF